MAIVQKAVIILLVIKVVCELSMAMGSTFYRVGDHSGWTTIGNVNYKSWASSKNFNVGDTILFEYNKQFHNVLRVTHKNFNTCNSTAPYATYATGNDSFTVLKPGHYYFICSVQGHCEAGQKVDIRVVRSNGPAGRASAPVPTVSPGGGPPPSRPDITPPPSTLPSKPLSPSPLPVAGRGPVPSHKNGGASLYLSWMLWAPAVVLASAC